MDDEARASEARLVEYIESLAQVLGYVDRAGPLKDYCTGLLMPGERKSVEPSVHGASAAQALERDAGASPRAHGSRAIIGRSRPRRWRRRCRKRLGETCHGARAPTKP